MKRGFTLIELLVVISILAILTAVLLPNMIDIRQRGSDSSKKSNLNELRTAMRLFYNDYQQFPNENSGMFAGCGGVDQYCGPGDSFEIGDTIYMQSVPEYESYEQLNNGDGFRISIELDNSADTEICESWNRCGVSGTCSSDETLYYVCAN